MSAATQKVIDDFYQEHGECCAGCDHWRWLNALVGECNQTAPVSSSERHSMLGFTSPSINANQAGHILTKRDHVCGQFVDTFDWGKRPEQSTQTSTQPE